MTEEKPISDEHKLKKDVHPIEPKIPEVLPEIKKEKPEDEPEYIYEDEEEETALNKRISHLIDVVTQKEKDFEAEDKVRRENDEAEANEILKRMKSEKKDVWADENLEPIEVHKDDEMPPEEFQEMVTKQLEDEVKESNEELRAIEEEWDKKPEEDEKPYVSEEAKRKFAETINKVTGENGSEEQQENKYTRDVLIDRWKGFLEKFYIGGEERVYKYFEEILGLRAKAVGKKGDIGSTVLVLDYEDLVITTAVDYQKELMDGIVNRYSENIDAIKSAVYQILQNIQPEYADQIQHQIIVSVVNSPNLLAIADISVRNIDKLVRIEGQVSQFDNENQIKVLENAWECANGHITKTDANQLQKPKKCNVMSGEVSFRGNSMPCGAPIILERTDLQKVVDICYIRINEREIKIPEGRIDAPSIDVRFEGTEVVKYVMSKVGPGQLISIDGVIRTRQMSGANHTLRDYEIEGSSYIILPESILVEDDPDLDYEVRKDIPEEEIPEHFKKLVRSVAAHLEGLVMEKTALLVQLAGADPKIVMAGGRLRGDINILLVSSPSQGKTELLKWQARIRPRSIFISGRGASAIGLTAGIEQVDIVKNGQRISTRRIGFGIYPLARGGIVCLDEVEKRSKEDYESLSHPMDDQQEVTVAKASMYKTIPATCASLHAGNPTKNNGRYDHTKDLFAQINFASWLFSRYDLIFALEDDNTDARRERLQDYISDAYDSARLEQDLLSVQEGTVKPTKVVLDKTLDWFPWQYMRREIMYLRATYHPKFNFKSDAGILLWKFWQRYSTINITPNTDPDAKPEERKFTPAMDKRKIGSLIRIAEAVARLFRSNTVELHHMEIAVTLMKASIKSIKPQETAKQISQGAYVKSISRTVAEAKSKEFKRGYLERQRDLRQRLVKFGVAVHKMAWEKCNICHGSGDQKYLADEQAKAYQYQKCPNCLGTKGQYGTIGFTYKDVINRIPQDLAITAKECASLWKWYVLKGWLRTVNPGYYKPVVNLVAETEKLKRFPIDSEILVEEQDLDEYERINDQLSLPKPKNKDDLDTFYETKEDIRRFSEKEDGSVV